MSKNLPFYQLTPIFRALENVGKVTCRLKRSHRPLKKKIEYSRVANKKCTSKNNVGNHSKYLLCSKSILAVHAAAARIHQHPSLLPPLPFRCSGSAQLKERLSFIHHPPPPPPCHAPHGIHGGAPASRNSASADCTPCMNTRACQASLQGDETLCCCSSFFRGQSIQRYRQMHCRHLTRRGIHPSRPRPPPPPHSLIRLGSCQLNGGYTSGRRGWCGFCNTVAATRG